MTCLKKIVPSRLNKCMAIFLGVQSHKGKGSLQVVCKNLELIQFSEENSEGTADCGHWHFHNCNFSWNVVQKNMKKKT